MVKINGIRIATKGEFPEAFLTLRCSQVLCLKIKLTNDIALRRLREIHPRSVVGDTLAGFGSTYCTMFCIVHVHMCFWQNHSQCCPKAPQPLPFFKYCSTLACKFNSILLLSCVQVQVPYTMKFLLACVPADSEHRQQDG